MTRSKVMPPVFAAPYVGGLLGHKSVGAGYRLLIKDGCENTDRKITNSTKVTMPVCPSDWATNGFAPFGDEAKQRGREMQRYIKEKFHRSCTFFERDGELFVTFYVGRVSHREINWFKRVFWVDDREHTFKDVGV